MEPVRRIAHRVSNSPAAGRYFAIGSSPEMRRRAENALAEMLGASNLVSLDLSGIEDDPWNWLRRYQQAEARDPQGVLYCVHGLSALCERASEAGRPHPFAQLNFARDAWGKTGTHLLLWLDGIAAFDSFLELAPDLWSHRDVVAWFLTREDFVDPAWSAVGLADKYGPRIEAAKRQLADGKTVGEARLRATVELADALVARGESLAAWGAIEAHTLVTTRNMGSPDLSINHHRLRNGIQVRLGRNASTATDLTQWLKSERHAPTWLRNVIESGLAQALMAHKPERAIPILRRLSLVDPRGAEPRGFGSDAADNLVLTLAHQGQPQAALRVAVPAANESPNREAWNLYRLGAIARTQGDYPAALRADDRAARYFTTTGDDAYAASAWRRVSGMLEDWGLTEEAEALLGAAKSGDEVAQLPFRLERWCRRWIRADAAATSLFREVLSSISIVADHPIARAASAAACHDILVFLEEDAEPTDSVFPALEKAIQSLVVTAKASNDKEVEGAARWAQARLALLAGDPTRAYALADRTLIPWCRRWRGLVAESGIWGLLARSAPSPAIGLDRAERAVAVADRSPSVFAQIAARQTLAVVHVRGDRVADAAACLNDALALARAEGLRLNELALLHDLAELPNFKGARAAAGEALTLALVLMLPREEARALLNVALTSHQAGEPLSARRLDRAREIVEELGPPRLRTRVLAALAMPTYPPAHP